MVVFVCPVEWSASKCWGNVLLGSCDLKNHPSWFVPYTCHLFYLLKYRNIMNKPIIWFISTRFGHTCFRMKCFWRPCKLLCWDQQHCLSNILNGEKNTQQQFNKLLLLHYLQQLSIIYSTNDVLIKSLITPSQIYLSLKLSPNWSEMNHCPNCGDHRTNKPPETYKC